jgi:hypothetical protein
MITARPIAAATVSCGATRNAAGKTSPSAPASSAMPMNRTKATGTSAIQGACCGRLNGNHGMEVRCPKKKRCQQQLPDPQNPVPHPRSGPDKGLVSHPSFVPPCNIDVSAMARFDTRGQAIAESSSSSCVPLSVFFARGQGRDGPRRQRRCHRGPGRSLEIPGGMATSYASGLEDSTSSANLFKCALNVSCCRICSRKLAGSVPRLSAACVARTHGSRSIDASVPRSGGEDDGADEQSSPSALRVWAEDFHSPNETTLHLVDVFHHLL